MSRSYRCGALAAALVFVLSPLVAGCAAGFDAATGQVTPDNPSVELGPLKIQNVSVVTGASGAALTAAIFNNGTQQDQLTQVSVPGAGGASLSPVAIPPGGAVFIGGTGGPTVTFGAGQDVLEPGTFVTLTMTFASAGQQQVQVPVYAGTGFYQDLAPGGPPATRSPPAGEALGRWVVPGRWLVTGFS